MLDYLFHPAAEKELAHLPIKGQSHIMAKIQEVCQLNHPLQHRKVIKLEGRHLEEFRLRVGDYRVKFVFREPKTIFVTHIHHRQVGY